MYAWSTFQFLCLLCWTCDDHAVTNSPFTIQPLKAVDITILHFHYLRPVFITHVHYDGIYQAIGHHPFIITKYKALIASIK